MNPESSQGSVDFVPQVNGHNKLRDQSGELFLQQPSHDVPPTGAASSYEAEDSAPSPEDNTGVGAAIRNGKPYVHGLKA